MRLLRRFLAPLLVAAVAAGLITTHVAAQDPAQNLEVILAIDTSGSMRRAIPEAKAAANEFIASMPADVRIGLMTFADDVTVLSEPTVDRAVLAAQINGIATGGNTALYDMVVESSRHFTPNVGHKVLVVLSDGKDDGSTAALADAVAAVKGEYVEAISLTTPQTDLTSLTALGRVTPADDAARMSAAFARVTALIAVVAVQPTVPATTAVTPSTAPATTAIAATATTSPAVVTPAQPATTAAASSGTSPTLWLGALGVFIGLFALLVVLLAPRQRVSKARLGIDKPRSVSEFGKRTVSAVDGALERRGKRSDLAMSLSVADISMQPGEFVATVGAVAVIAGLVGFVIGGLFLALVLGAAVCLSVHVYISHTKAKRQAAFADQLPDVLQLVTTALRSGYGLTQALDSVAEEAEEPARSEFTHVLVESRLGRDLSDAMRALAKRMQSQDLDWVVGAIDINRETGGNLSEILNTVGDTIRERQRMARQVRTLTAEGRLSARILTVLPFLMAFWQWRVNPANFKLLTYGPGLAAVCVAAILMIIGTLWIHKIVNSLAE